MRAFTRRLAVLVTMLALSVGALARNEGLQVPRRPTTTADAAERLRAIPAQPMPMLTREELERRMRGGTAPEDAADFAIAPAVQAGANQVQRANVHEPPFQSAGKLFFDTPSGEVSCTAQFVGDDSNVLLTAAHCVRDGNTGAWYQNFRFQRAYADGGGQAVSILCAATRSEWVNGSNYAFDYAFLRTNESSEAGAMGLRGGIYPDPFVAVGYPGNFDEARFLERVDGQLGDMGNGLVAMLGNPMRQGSSGGAWIDGVITAPGDRNYAFGLNSFGVDAYPNVVYGPRFTEETAALFTYTRNGCR